MLLTLIGGMLIGAPCKVWMDKYYPLLKIKKIVWRLRH